MTLMPDFIGYRERVILEEIRDEEYLADVAEYLAKIQRPRSEPRILVLG